MFYASYLVSIQGSEAADELCGLNRGGLLNVKGTLLKYRMPDPDLKARANHGCSVRNMMHRVRSLSRNGTLTLVDPNYQILSLRLRERQNTIFQLSYTHRANNGTYEPRLQAYSISTISTKVGNGAMVRVRPGTQVNSPRRALSPLTPLTMNS
jgi:hypothetical protein